MATPSVLPVVHHRAVLHPALVSAEVVIVFNRETPMNRPGGKRFRNNFGLEAVPERFTIQVSADNRYRLYVNGVSVVAGPQRS